MPMLPPFFLRLKFMVYNFMVDWEAIIAISSMISAICSVATVYFLFITLKTTIEAKRDQEIKDLQKSLDRNFEILMQTNFNDRK